MVEREKPFCLQKKKKKSYINGSAEEPHVTLDLYDAYVVKQLNILTLTSFS